MTRVEEVGDRIDELLREGGGPVAEELVRLLVGLYGDGLTRVVGILKDSGEDGEAVLDRMLGDPLVESLLMLHDLHPLDVDARIQQALDRVRPYLGSHAGGVRYLGVADGVARLQLEGSCNGCASSTTTVKLAIEGAVRDAAPEVTEVEVEGVTAPPPLLQIGRRPSDGGGWVALPDLGPPSSRPVVTEAAGFPVLVCAVRGTLYAYRDTCAACGATLEEGRLERAVLTCQCGAQYDVTKAGRALDDSGRHLDPLPLLSDSQGVRVATPAAVSR